MTIHMILVIDNYDSFVYNLARYFEILGYPTQVCRNDAITLSQITALKPSHIVISPGPGTPQEAGLSIDIIKQFAHIPLLGVCLGHQAIGQAFGATINRAKQPLHGRASHIHHNETSIFAGIANPFLAGRYHSLVIDPRQLPPCLEILARSDEGEIMAIRHRHYPMFGVQFHPESILTEHGLDLINRFVQHTHLEKEAIQRKKIKEWTQAAKLVTKNSEIVNKDFQTHSSIKSS